jgi:hypothetical protein
MSSVYALRSTDNRIAFLPQADGRTVIICPIQPAPETHSLGYGCGPIASSWAGSGTGFCSLPCRRARAPTNTVGGRVGGHSRPHILRVCKKEVYVHRPAGPLFFDVLAIPYSAWGCLRFREKPTSASKRKAFPNEVTFHRGCRALRICCQVLHLLTRMALAEISLVRLDLAQAPLRHDVPNPTEKESKFPPTS